MEKIMEIENNKEEVPFGYYENLFREADAQTIADRLGVAFDGKEFTVELLGKRYNIAWPEYAIRQIECACGDGPMWSSAPTLPTQTFLLRYLLEAKKVVSGGAWRTFREMPWGELYIKPYTGRVLTRAAFTFGTRLEKFKAASEKMGGIPVNHGDAGYQFQLVDGYHMQILVWEGDDEFPPNAQILYSDNFAEGFGAEDRVVAGDILISAIKGNM